MILFLAAALAVSLVANLAQAITSAHLIERRSTRRPREQRPPTRQHPHPVDPSRPHRTPASAKPRVSLLADTTEIRPRGKTHA